MLLLPILWYGKLLIAICCCALFFRGTCSHVPKPAVCRGRKAWYQTILSWDTFFASILATVVSVPVTVVRLMFKRRVFIVKQSERNKEITMKIWKWKKRFGWLLGLCIHVLCFTFLVNFVRFYPWTIFEKWLSAASWCFFHRNSCFR